MKKTLLYSLSLFLMVAAARAQKKKEGVLKKLDNQAEVYGAIAQKIWNLTAMVLFKNKDLVAKAKVEFIERRGADFKYIPLLGDRPPALDYRK